ncbi:uncharacterized protein V1510DRAFT_417639 [Dipodascopsis tothii]|uniref:uncharacterized protein n=1 Tax=Dipodascopsis tothii TaxID=44089 RepID=UPI0034CE3AB9
MARAVLTDSGALKKNVTQQEFAEMSVWSRVSLYNWKADLSFAAIILVYVGLYTIGTYFNKKKATAWITSTAETLKKQFFQVGFEGTDVATSESAGVSVSKLIKKVTSTEFVTYATGRLNVAYVHGKLTLMTRHDGFMFFLDYVFSFVFGYETPHDKVEYFIRPSDEGNTKYDGFVFAVVHKDKMKKVREDSYDLSLTRTSDHPKLPVSFTVMSEANEVTETFFTKEFLAAIEGAKDLVDYVVLSDLPAERPTDMSGFDVNKRVLVSMKVAGTPEQEAASAALLEAVIGLVDVAVAKAHWRPEVLRKLAGTRDKEQKKLQKVIDEERAEEVAKQKAKDKKERDEELVKGLSAEEQRKVQQREREKELRRKRAKQTRRV